MTYLEQKGCKQTGPEGHFLLKRLSAYIIPVVTVNWHTRVDEKESKHGNRLQRTGGDRCVWARLPAQLELL